MRITLKAFDSDYLVSVKESRLKGISKWGAGPCKWIITCGGDPHVRAWREAVIFGRDENKKKITTILRKFKGSKFKFSIFGAEEGKKDCVMFNFYFDWKKDTQCRYQIVFKDFSEILLTLESKIKEVRQRHEAKVKSEAEEKEKEREIIKQEIKKARELVKNEREKGDKDAAQFSAKIKDLIVEICERGVEVGQIDKAVDFLFLAYYYGYKDISETRLAGNWFFLEALNQRRERKSVYLWFDFMRDLDWDLMERCKEIKE
ncbi:hypothetical protein HpHA227_14850 [Helicobacter pylori]